ncbi:hypothetical protein JDV02_007158 [Purpureocillium takamizusanense]|uniref:CFEM domain-containing protein n=1 Tax=Purpureocillium takamizusanense TaxID=2060973 RepID=A0A9Q8QMF0_9HYPO|nr:uncharacterized protein JDV02_007158 [Purpureocillium takamizusanense]UNI21142.1 hypothetical protein JDV02_007158 [Purpureocillium takamizusanense]
MKAVALFVSLAAGLAAAQSVGDIPECAKKCATGLLEKKVGDCETTDIGCFCRNKDFINNIVCCIDQAKSCTQDELEKTLSFARKLCSTSNVQLPDTVPKCSSSSSASGSATGGSSSTAASTASGGGASATTTGTAGAASGTTKAASSSSTAAAAAIGGGSVGGLAGAVLAVLAAM